MVLVQIVQIDGQINNIVIITFIAVVDKSLVDVNVVTNLIVGGVTLIPKITVKIGDSVNDVPIKQMVVVTMAIDGFNSEVVEISITDCVSSLIIEIS